MSTRHTKTFTVKAKLEIDADYAADKCATREDIEALIRQALLSSPFINVRRIDTDITEDE